MACYGSKNLHESFKNRFKTEYGQTNVHFWKNSTPPTPEAHFWRSKVPQTFQKSTQNHPKTDQKSNQKIDRFLTGFLIVSGRIWYQFWRDFWCFFWMLLERNGKDTKHWKSFKRILKIWRKCSHNDQWKICSYFKKKDDKFHGTNKYFLIC